MLPDMQAQSVGFQPLMDKISHRGEWLFEKLGLVALAVGCFFAIWGFVKTLQKK